MNSPLLFGKQALGERWDLRLGKQEVALAGVEVDALIADPPYGSRTHKSTRGKGNIRADGRSMANLAPAYDHWERSQVDAFVDDWSPRVRGWFAAMTSHDLVEDWQRAHTRNGRYCFAPIPCVMRGMSVRLAGDGPSSWTVYLVVARPRVGADRDGRPFSKWGTLPGAYVGGRGSEAGGGRGKPAWLLRAIVADYTRPGDLIADPFAGWGSTLAAAAELGRDAIGAEFDLEAFREAERRLRRPPHIQKTKRPRKFRAPQIEMFRNSAA